MDFISVVAIIVVVLMAVVFTAVFVSQRAKYKALEFESKKKQEDLAEKEQLLVKEAMIKAKDALQTEREQLNEEERERRQELSRQESKLAQREDALEDKIQTVIEILSFLIGSGKYEEANFSNFKGAIPAILKDIAESLKSMIEEIYEQGTFDTDKYYKLKQAVDTLKMIL